jgi:putative membrane protein
MISGLECRLLVFGILLALAISIRQPYDLTIWFLEAFPVIAGLPVLILTHRHFPLTPLAYRLLFLHALILLLGAHYTYARVPLGFWMQDVFDFGRNHYDRIGHLAQGFIPAILAREILIRKTRLISGGWLFFLVTCVCLSISVFYEFIEWWIAVLSGAVADDFLATQGDIWDTQWDMLMAMIGALSAQLLFGRYHDGLLKNLRQG